MISIMGFGKHGNTAVNAIPDNSGIDKLYVGSNKDDFQNVPEEGRVLLDYHYEISAWDPTFEVKLFLRSNETQEMLREYFSKVSMVVMVMGLGGTLSLAAKEFLKFLMEEQISVYVVCSKPFRREISEYEYNIRYNEMIRFLHSNSNKFGWTLVDNEELINVDITYQKAYDTAHTLLTDIVMTMLAMPDESESLFWTKIMVSDLEHIVNRSLIYVSYVESKREDTLSKKSIINRFLPYMPDKNSEGLLVMEIPSGIDSILEIDQKLNEILQCLGGSINFICRLVFSKRESSEEMYRYWFLCRGVEINDKKIVLHEISFF